MAKEYSEGHSQFAVPLTSIYQKDVLVPQYYDMSYRTGFEQLKAKWGFCEISLGDLIERGIIEIQGGHGSPSNDLRNGTIPYVKVSDIRNLRINVNPTNLIPIELARRFWKTNDGRSNLKGWDLISPSRASSNIGEFSILVPGEEQIVLTKEVFVLRVQPNDLGIDPFYMLWALALREVRDQWRRVTLMQTNREDVGKRFCEVCIPMPLSPKWAKEVSCSFRKYFESIAKSKETFVKETQEDRFDYIASVSAFSDKISD